MATVTRAALAADLRRLGVRPGGVLFVHTRMSALGWVDGGSEAVVGALLDALGPQGTLAAYAGWQDHAFAGAPVFEPETAEATRENGRIPEQLRVWPGARASAHPEARVVAVGPRAEWLVAPHGDHDGYGADTPFARVVEAGGQVLLLGAPLDTLTLLHHAEAIAPLPGKRRLRSTIPVREPGGEVVEHSYDDTDTDTGTYAYETLGLAEDAFAVIAREALAAGAGVSGRVGTAECHLFEAGPLVAVALDWLGARFGDR